MRKPTRQITPLEAEAIVRMYTKEEMSQQQVAKALGITGTSVRNTLLKQGVTLRTYSEAAKIRKKKISKREELAQDENFKRKMHSLYHEARWSIRDCAKECNINATLLGQVFGDWGWKDERRYYKLETLDAEKVCSQYKEGMSLKEVALLHNVSSTTIQRLLIKHDVTLRTATQGRALYLKNNPEIQRKSKRARTSDDDVKPGDYVSYNDRSAQFIGTQDITVDDKTMPFLVLKCHGSQMQYLPTHRIKDLMKLAEIPELLDRIDDDPYAKKRFVPYQISP